MAELVAAVDVGTGSARAGLFDAAGRMLGRAEHAIALREPAPGRAEQDSEGIWAAAGAALRAARAEAGASAEAVAGVGFDATCSLVLRDRQGMPLAASCDGEAVWDTMLWLDHRARAEAAEITATGHEVVAGIGGSMSPEMQLPKLLWLKRHRPDAWARLGAAFDLADFLTWKATGGAARSICTLACKWGYLGHAPPGWRSDFLAEIGLADLRERAGLPARGAPARRRSWSPHPHGGRRPRPHATCPRRRRDDRRACGRARGRRRTAGVGPRQPQRRWSRAPRTA